MAGILRKNEDCAVLTPGLSGRGGKDGGCMFGRRESKVCHRPGKAVEKGELRVRTCARVAGAGRRDQ